MYMKMVMLNHTSSIKIKIRVYLGLLEASSILGGAFFI